ncbi:hypothetical protein DEAC_c43810 [Desulfosporosinus acididurans]|uniref:Uncharacterized protein n=1 Tax=Desulfosporosinus acididurans TaxID=476652 RepID=A0A0J1FJS9_9FIRM|nr:hypothetical protein [Desulfosporosinus acididurans]KLU63695.1 hypothetical protein DEAC_c43810 [Desulfosporosinus acididurans]
MKKFGMILALLCILSILLPGVAMATTYNNSIPSGSILVGWVVGNSGGQATISFSFSGNSGVTLPTSIPFDSSWHALDDIRPILLAHKNGDDNYLGGTNGVFGSNIKFSDNVLAAMKVQNFNPAQLGGANIPPSSTTLNSDQTAWLQRVGYSGQSTGGQTAPAQTPTPAPVTQAQTQNNPPSQSTSSKQSSSTTSQQSKANANASSSAVKSNPAIGQTVKTPSGPMTQDMVAADKNLSAQNPPSQNPANIPTKSPAKEETKAHKNIWLWVATGVAILTLAAVAGRIIYKRTRLA